MADRPKQPLNESEETAPGNSSPPMTGPGPGSQPANAWIIAGSMFVLVMLAGLNVYVMLKVWPHPTPNTSAPGMDAPTPAQPQAPANEPAVRSQSVFEAADRLRLVAQRSDEPTGGDNEPPAGQPPMNQSAAGFLWCTVMPADSLDRWIAIEATHTDARCVNLFGASMPIWDEQLLLLLTLLGGALGGLVHAMRSMAWYIGNRELRWSWLGYYLFLPFVGGMLGVGFYVLIRGGFFAGNTTIEDTSPFSFAALGFIVGLFSTQATLKLNEVANVFFTKPQPGQDPAPSQSAKE